ncbi:helix-turn-helix domain-containing protein [Pontibacter sp. BT310]|uniref:AraC family transcriptional regulator n=1 Tax=Pontibacter populi TaxID=890055 RepID=A0ABS6XF40_9BACT|nr:MULTISPECIES: helix-turn-helix domain-containing protein [Pontibacter]MBJ6119727.1 helix-turn-helix domain-containing protein [Pontibacter sp. BT310]MBR0572156.1 helix-turn-helix domain-containing protein [Microvirga sp. STS03]MBW3366580.1 AraC family transcriptional regulator [Pontibacter populi]
MPEANLPIYQIKDFNASSQQERYFYMKSFAQHLQEHAFIQKPHKHDFYMLLFVTQGAGTHTIDFETYPVEPGSTFFLTPGQLHSWQLSPETDGFIVFFTPSFYLLDFSHHKLYSFPFFHGLMHKPMLQLSAKDWASLKTILHSIEIELAAQQLYADAIIRNYLDILLLQLSRLYKSEKQEQQLPVGMLSQVEVLQNLIEENYKEHKPVSFYADKLHTTPKQLNEYSKRVLGKTITDLIHDRVILEAKRLLVHSDLTISQVATELGYFDNAYFFRFFKKKTNYTPEQFRKENL